MSEGTACQNSLWSCIWIFKAKNFRKLYLHNFSFAKNPGWENISLHYITLTHKRLQKGFGSIAEGECAIEKKEKNYLTEDLANLIFLHFYGMRTFSHKYKKGMSCYTHDGEFLLKPNYFKKQSSSSSFLLT